MVKLKDFAEQYEPKKTKNIAELEVVRTDIDIREEVFKEGTEDEFSVNVSTINGEDYRIPDSVIASLKEILQEAPGLKAFKVRKSGSGMNTKYTVIPLD